MRATVDGNVLKPERLDWYQPLLTIPPGVKNRKLPHRLRSCEQVEEALGCIVCISILYQRGDIDVGSVWTSASVAAE